MLAWMCYCSGPLPTLTRLIYTLIASFVQACSNTSRSRKKYYSRQLSKRRMGTPGDCREVAHPTWRTGSASCSFANARNWRGTSRNPEGPQSSRGRLWRSLRNLRETGGFRCRYHACQAAVLCGDQAGAAQRWAVGHGVHTPRPSQSGLQPRGLHLIGRPSPRKDITPSQNKGK